MNDTLNKKYIEFQNQISMFNDEMSRNIRELVEDIVELEIKRVKNLRLIEVKAYQLRKDDIIFNPYLKTLHKITFVEKRTDCQFNIPKNNTEILVMYGEDEPSDYFDYLSNLFILVDVGEIAFINKRTLDGIPEEGDLY